MTHASLLTEDIIPPEIRHVGSDRRGEHRALVHFLVHGQPADHLPESVEELAGAISRAQLRTLPHASFSRGAGWQRESRVNGGELKSEVIQGLVEGELEICARGGFLREDGGKVVACEIGLLVGERGRDGYVPLLPRWSVSKEFELPVAD